MNKEILGAAAAAIIASSAASANSLVTAPQALTAIAAPAAGARTAAVAPRLGALPSRSGLATTAGLSLPGLAPEASKPLPGLVDVLKPVPVPIVSVPSSIPNPLPSLDAVWNHSAWSTVNSQWWQLAYTVYVPGGKVWINSQFSYDLHNWTRTTYNDLRGVRPLPGFDPRHPVIGGLLTGPILDAAWWVQNPCGTSNPCSPTNSRWAGAIQNGAPAKLTSIANGALGGLKPPGTPPSPVKGSL